MQKKPILALEHISKNFPGVKALDDVSFSLRAGEVHALLGENGAGKSTLIKIMTGIYRQDIGRILLNGEEIHLHSSAHAQRYGIAAIYQEPMVFPDLNVAENIFIGHTDQGLVVNWGGMYKKAEEILSTLGVSLDVRSQTRGLTLAAQQMVEIAKAISQDVRVLIMDEPTASLSAHEVEQLFALVRVLRDKGVAILFISHRMEEIFQIADHVTIFRDGKRISSYAIEEVQQERLIQDMVGRELEAMFVRDFRAHGDQVLSVRHLSKEGVFDDITFDLHEGEILGFAGLVGARRTDVGLALFGIEPADGGEILLRGKPVHIQSPAHALELKIAYVTEDRRQLGLSLSMSVIANLSLPQLGKYLNLLGLIRRKHEIETAERYRQQLNIRTPSLWQEAGKLSGGNQQKVVLSKWLNTDPQVLILDEPTRGIDVGAKAEVHQIINDLAGKGIAIILISSDLPEVMGMSDRILVMREGRQMGIFKRAGTSREQIISAAMGMAEGEAGA